MPMSPRAASFGIRSAGNSCASSHALTYGRISVSANSRTLRRSSSWSSVKRRSIAVGLRLRSYHSLMRRFVQILAATLVVLAVSSPAFADATLFLGSTMTPANRAAKGIAIGVGLLIVGFEFEFSDTGETPLEGAPGLRTGMGNVLLQT